MPKGTMRRYINFVVGLLVIFTVINPFINLSNLDFQLEREVFRNIDNQIDDSEDLISGQDAQIEYLYKEKITREEIDYVENNTEYTVASIELDIDKTEENFGAISYLGLWIESENIELDEESIDIDVEPVTLEAKVTRKDVDMAEYLPVKNLISDRYEIESDLINISKNKLED